MLMSAKKVFRKSVVSVVWIFTAFIVASRSTLQYIHIGGDSNGKTRRSIHGTVARYALMFGSPFDGPEPEPEPKQVEGDDPFVTLTVGFLLGGAVGFMMLVSRGIHDIEPSITRAFEKMRKSPPVAVVMQQSKEAKQAISTITNQFCMEPLPATGVPHVFRSGDVHSSSSQQDPFLQMRQLACSSASSILEPSRSSLTAQKPPQHQWLGGMMPRFEARTVEGPKKTVVDERVSDVSDNEEAFGSHLLRVVIATTAQAVRLAVPSVACGGAVWYALQHHEQRVEKDIEPIRGHARPLAPIDDNFGVVEIEEDVRVRGVSASASHFPM